jgi:NSS family neurotransmitter:Na+ symporter
VIGGWVSKYLAVFATGGAQEAASKGYFDSFISQPVEPILWFLLFIGLTALVVFFGVEKGVEKVSKFMMPVLVVLTLGIAIYSMCMPCDLYQVDQCEDGGGL